jgi:hypothetical protein
MPRTKKHTKKSNSLGLDLSNFFSKSKSKSKRKSKTQSKTQSEKRSRSKHLDKYFDNDNILSIFYTFNAPLNTGLIKYNDKESKYLIKNSLNNIKLTPSYNISSLEDSFKKVDSVFKAEIDLCRELKLLNNKGTIDKKKFPHQVQYATEDFARGMRDYINTRYVTSLPLKISNGFVKLWEILHTFKPMSLNAKKFRVFHMCESPGQMIMCAKYFAETKYPNIVDYDWVANSLNPYNPYVKKNFEAVPDTYGLIKKYPQKWLWGADNTGDITNTKNIKWLSKYINDKWLSKGVSLDLITGDAGTGSESSALILQKLDLGQAIATVACSSIGGNCIIKHFSPYITTNSETLDATSFFVSYIYLYYITFEDVSIFKPYSSDLSSGEFYIIGKNFIGIDNSSLERLYKCLDNFKTNNAIFEKESLPETFIIQINNFIEQLSNSNINGIEKTNYLLTCYKESKDKMKNKDIKKSKTMKNVNSKCNNFLNANNIETILVPRYNQWIKLYEFE